MTNQSDNDFQRYDRVHLIKSQERLDFRMHAIIADALDIITHNDAKRMGEFSKKVSAEMKRGNRRMTAALHVLLCLATSNKPTNQRANDVRAFGKAMNVM